MLKSRQEGDRHAFMAEKAKNAKVGRQTPVIGDFGDERFRNCKRVLENIFANRYLNLVPN